jgi:uncharacterized protein YhfF
MWGRVDGRRVLGLDAPGRWRDGLNELVLTGQKTATAGLHRTVYAAENEELETVGEQLVLLDSRESPIGLLEVTRVETCPFVDAPWELASAENEGDESIEEWREGHRRYFARVGTPVADDDLIVCVWFRLVSSAWPPSDT